MDMFFKVIFGGGSAVGIAAVLFFTPPQVQKQENDIVVRGRLKGCITEKVNRILRTGAQVTIHYHFSLIRHETDSSLVYIKKKKHTFRFDNLTGNYIINKDGDEYRLADRNEVNELLGSYFLIFSGVHSFPGNFYDFYAEAELSYPSSIGIDNSGRAIWDYYIPNIKVKGISFK